MEIPEHAVLHVSVCIWSWCCTILPLFKGLLADCAEPISAISMFLNLSSIVLLLNVFLPVKPGAHVLGSFYESDQTKIEEITGGLNRIHLSCLLIKTVLTKIFCATKFSHTHSCCCGVVQHFYFLFYIGHALIDRNVNYVINTIHLALWAELQANVLTAIVLQQSYRSLCDSVSL